MPRRSASLSPSFAAAAAALAAVAVLGAPAPGRACGPDFPTSLLTDRLRWMSTFPRPDFASEAMRLVPAPAGRFETVDGDEPEGARQGGGAREGELYAEGAVRFRQGDTAAAREAFQRVLALPAAERRRFSTYAAFMLGRTGCRDAGRWFAETRKLAAAGFDDPAGLAAASFGEEARRLLDPAAHACAGEEAPGRDDAAAVRLYAQQAALGSQSGAISLLFVARALARDPARLQRALPDPVVQQVLALYAWTRIDEDFEWRTDARADVVRAVDALAALPKVEGGDRLAIALWRAGRFDEAERFARMASTPLASWVKAKAALRRGDRAEAERRLAEASAAVPEDELWGDTDWQYRPQGRLEGERTVLALARDDDQAALRHVLASGYLLDVLYVTERVLTVDELRSAVDAGIRLGRPPPRDQYPATPVDAKLVRAVLARRLMRLGRREEAVRYFDDPKVAARARRYADALARAQRGPPASRAAALYEAARLARWRGLELLGTDLAPDGGVFGGDYEVELTPASLLGSLSAEDRAGWPVIEAPARTRLVGKEELRRLAASAPRPDVRFHYREIAADHAEAAAALVPPRSQAHAALLCHAASWIRYRDPARYRRLWRAYVKGGRAFAFGASFGSDCPAPELEVPADGAEDAAPGPEKRPAP